MGVIFLKRSLHTSRHTGTYLSNRMVKLARSDCTSRVSIQLLTYLCTEKKHWAKIWSDFWELYIPKKLKYFPINLTLHCITQLHSKDISQIYQKRGTQYPGTKDQFYSTISLPFCPQLGMFFENIAFDVALWTLKQLFSEFLEQKVPSLHDDTSTSRDYRSTTSCIVSKLSFMQTYLNTFKCWCFQHFNKFLNVSKYYVHKRSDYLMTNDDSLMTLV